MLSSKSLLPPFVRIVFFMWMFSQSSCQGLRKEEGAVMVDSMANISCFKCHYWGKSSEWLGDATKSGKKLSLLDKVIQEECSSMQSNLHECPEGVNKCVLTITEEKVRKSREDNDKNEGYMVVSQFCGHAEDVETGCRKHGLTTTKGMQVKCVCGGTGCNYKINKAMTAEIHLRLMILVTMVMIYVKTI